MPWSDHEVEVLVMLEPGHTGHLKTPTLPPQGASDPSALLRASKIGTETPEAQVTHQQVARKQHWADPRT